MPGGNFGAPGLGRGVGPAEREELKMTSGGRQLGTMVRLGMATAVLCAAFAALAPSVAHGNYLVRECNSTVGNADAVMIRPFGGATKVAQSDDCLNWGLRMEANGQSTLNTYVVWQWTAPPSTTFKTAQTKL